MNLEWTPDYAVGVDKFDDHHKELFAIIKSLYDSFVAEDSGKLATVTKELSAYADFHFGAEEDAMKAHNYPDTDAHLDEHKKFVAYVNEHFTGADAHDAEGMSAKMEFAVNWLINHIGERDKAYGAWFSEQGITIS